MRDTQSIPLVSVVILNYNGKKHLAQFLPSVLASNYPNFDVIIADNASSDDSLEFLRTHYPTLQVITLPQNYGFAEGYNQALKQIKSAYYILLNSDVEVQPDWISPLIAVMQQDRTIAATQPKILAFHDKSKFEHAGAAGGWIDSLAYPFCRGRIFDEVETDEGQYDDCTEIFWASGAALCIRGDLFHQIGGFDGDYFAHMEEIDLCWRLKRAGYKIMVEPKAVVYHVGGGTLDYSSPFKVFLNFRNSLFTILKNESWVKLSWFLLFRFCLDGLSGILYLSKKQYYLTWQIIRAHFAFYGSFFKMLQKRRMYDEKIATIRIAENNKSAIYSQSIVFQYFIKKIRRFSAILNLIKS
jgi:GT2 family glycosyltransferase